MFYLYKNTKNDSQMIAEFSDKDNALLYMEHLAMEDANPDVTGYAVRDYKLNIYAEMEK